MFQEGRQLLNLTRGTSRLMSSAMNARDTVTSEPIVQRSREESFSVMDVKVLDILRLSVRQMEKGKRKDP